MRRRLFYRRISLTEGPFLFTPRKTYLQLRKIHYINPNKNPQRKAKTPHHKLACNLQRINKLQNSKNKGA